MARHTTRFRWTARVVLAVIFLCFATRLVWHVSKTETGFHTLATQWWDASYGFGTGFHKPIFMKRPLHQADFWLQEVERVLDEHGNDAEIVMGAALILAKPDMSYGMEFSRVGREFDYGNESQQFQSKCRTRCLELAARATELEPENVELWRLRAMLHWEPLYESNSEPIDSDLADILAQCARHDPDNGLYDYLGARFDWEFGSTFDYSNGTEVFLIVDATAIKRSVARFELGQKRPIVAIGGDGYIITERFLNKANLSLVDKSELLRSRSLYDWPSLFLSELCRMQWTRGDEAEAGGNFSEAIEHLQKGIHVIQQFQDGGGITANSQVAYFHNSHMSLGVNRLSNMKPESFSNEELLGFRDAVDNSRNDEDAFKLAIQNLSAAYDQPTTSLGIPKTNSQVLIAAYLPGVVVILFLFGLPATAVACFVKSKEQLRIGPFRIWASFVLALVLSIVFFGLAPARVIGIEAQAWLFTVMIVGLPIGVVATVAVRMIRRDSFKFSLRSLLVLMFAGCVFAAPFANGLTIEAFIQIPFELKMPQFIWFGDFERTGGFYWVQYQWSNYRGQFLWLAIWAVMLVLMLGLKKTASEANGNESNRAGFGQFGLMIIGGMGKPFLNAGVFLFAAYLWIAPAVVDATEDHYQEQRGLLIGDRPYWVLLEEGIRKAKIEYSEIN